jgi:hypothetical protein
VSLLADEKGDDEDEDDDNDEAGGGEDGEEDEDEEEEGGEGMEEYTNYHQILGGDAEAYDDEGVRLCL